ncbi:MAG TPA: AbrB/MazE/SpoVT family DNA-binding domain-containing protein [Acidobacteriaceae bacterium]|nr:AbrB/MazE/SpoVT family DNA-binding domain-containing protein [Acidobacteriaceae bacterium]
MESTLTTKGQVTIPKEAREHLRLKPGDRVKFFIAADGHVVILPVLPITALKGILPARGKRASLTDMDEAIAKGAVARFRRSSKR